jgi:hypothetical protein
VRAIVLSDHGGPEVLELPRRAWHTWAWQTAGSGSQGAPTEMRRRNRQRGQELPTTKDSPNFLLTVGARPEGVAYRHIGDGFTGRS